MRIESTLFGGPQIRADNGQYTSPVQMAYRLLRGQEKAAIDDIVVVAVMAALAVAGLFSSKRPTIFG